MASNAKGSKGTAQYAPVKDALKGSLKGASKQALAARVANNRGK